MPKTRPVPLSARIALLGLGALMGCATPEYRSERATCNALWLRKLPAAYEAHVFTRFTWEREYAGQDCEKSGGTTVCTPRFRDVYRPEQVVEWIDVNAARRSAEILACTEAACLERYGNAQCKTAATAPAAAMPR